MQFLKTFWQGSLVNLVAAYLVVSRRFSGLRVGGPRLFKPLSSSGGLQAARAKQNLIVWLNRPKDWLWLLVFPLSEWKVKVQRKVNFIACNYSWNSQKVVGGHPCMHWVSSMSKSAKPVERRPEQLSHLTLIEFKWIFTSTASELQLVLRKI